MLYICKSGARFTVIVADGCGLSARGGRAKGSHDVERAKATIVKGLNNAEDDIELKIYLLSLKNAQLPETIDLLLDYAEDNSGVVKPSNTVLENKYLNYDEFSQPGSSTSFSGLLTATENMVSTFGVDLLFTETGFLKKSVSDITLFDQVHQMKAMQVSIEAQGLESLIGGGSVEESEDAAMVGMSATLFDVQLRPVVFFEGYMDLMSKVFSSSGDPISVVKGTVQLIDYNQRLPLQSGLQPIIECQVGIGLDILAKIDVILWEQKCKTNVNTTASAPLKVPPHFCFPQVAAYSGHAPLADMTAPPQWPSGRCTAGLVLEFNTGLDTSFFKTDLKSHVEAETTVSLDSMMALVDSPMNLCLELSHGDLPYRETYILSEYFPEKNITHTIQKGRKSMVWGRDFPLSSANSQMCTRVKYEEDQYNS
ncbi:Hypothetical predicted protein [Pelobates cultripes]|uniref:MTP large subunit lipid-binding domain-containing protein n=1 Tax=Pelobates cultripes TaxID=61616 RepID=A0AAD1TDX5_PELCU|nr:Hypothetical predicted protein [Pelobates cultripes]